MKLHHLIIGLAAAIATTTITRTAVWSFTADNSNSSISASQLALEPVTTGGAATQDVDTASQGNSGSQQPTVSKQSDASTESEKSLNISQNRSTNCQLIPQTSGGNVTNQLNALSKCNSGS